MVTRLYEWAMGKVVFSEEDGVRERNEEAVDVGEERSQVDCRGSERLGDTHARLRSVHSLPYLPITPSPFTSPPAQPFTRLRLTSNEISGLYTTAGTGRIGFGVESNRIPGRKYNTHQCQASSPAQARPAFRFLSPFRTTTIFPFSAPLSTLFDTHFAHTLRHPTL